MTRIALLALALAACTTPETLPDAAPEDGAITAPDAGTADSGAVSAPDAAPWPDADPRRPCDCEHPCQNGVCCGDDGYCYVPEDDPLRCVYGSPDEVPDAGACNGE